MVDRRGDDGVGRDWVFLLLGGLVLLFFEGREDASKFVHSFTISRCPILGLSNVYVSCIRQGVLPLKWRFYYQGGGEGGKVPEDFGT